MRQEVIQDESRRNCLNKHLVRGWDFVIELVGSEWNGFGIHVSVQDVSKKAGKVSKKTPEI